MNPRQFEELVCEHFEQHGYKTELTTYGNDFGIDGFARKGKEKIAIQAKMYGNTSRKINRQMVMELHGAKDFFDCTKGIIATNGTLLPDASMVAKKLNIEILYFDLSQTLLKKSPIQSIGEKRFEHIWETFILPLQGKTLIRENGETNQLLKVDWSGIERISSNGKKGNIKIEIFKLAINELLSKGIVTRIFINENYVGRASSGIILILSQVPFFDLTSKPSGLRYNL